jgi:hypothetical protein
MSRGRDELDPEAGEIEDDVAEGARTVAIR